MPFFRLTFCSAFILACEAAAASWAAEAGVESKANAGPWFSHFALTLEDGWREEAIGPFFYKQSRDTERMFAVPPLFSRVQDPGTDSEEYDFAYPLLTFNRYGHEYRWQFFQLFSFSGGHNQAEEPSRRFTLFPLYFQQRSPNPDLNYTALFPFYGHLKNRLLKDEISFVLFPLYAQTRRGSLVTDNYVLPFFHLRHGEKLHGWQFWPIVGREHKDVTTRTDGFGDTRTIGGHDKFFALWPFYFNETTGIGTENPEHQLAVLPLYASSRSPHRDSTTVLWPFFTWTDDREKKYREWDSPWPLVVFARGEGKTTTRLFPFFSHAHNATLQSDFYLWPLYKYNRAHSGALDRDRTRILFYLYSKSNEKNTGTGATRSRTDLWPLFTRRHDFNGNTRLQVLAPIEPILPVNKSVERNWSPVWSVWRAEKNPKTGHASQSLFWNLYRRETTPTTKNSSLLFGVFQYQSNLKTKHWRLFYLPLGKSQKESDHVSEHR